MAKRQSFGYRVWRTFRTAIIILGCCGLGLAVTMVAIMVFADPASSSR